MAVPCFQRSLWEIENTLDSDLDNVLGVQVGSNKKKEVLVARFLHSDKRGGLDLLLLLLLNMYCSSKRKTTKKRKRKNEKRCFTLLSPLFYAQQFYSIVAGPPSSSLLPRGV